MGFLEKIFGKKENEKALKRYEHVVDEVNAFAEPFAKLSDDALRAKTAEFKKALAAKEKTLNDIMPEAFAVVREAAQRVSGKRHYDVQIIGGAILHDGNLAEMRTGEGKTLVATLPSYLNALTEKGVHVVTVNDYLSQRDAVWMGQIHHFLGLTVGAIAQRASYLYDPAHVNESAEDADETRDEEGAYKVVHEFLRPVTRREAYEADITYGTNSEFGFDYLRDNIEYEERNLRQRGYSFAIIDEVDSILIDEARTPLIISAPAAESENLYETFAKIATVMEKEKDFTVDEKLKAVQMTDTGIDKAEQALGIDNIYTEKGIKYVHHLENAVRAKALYKRDTQYVVRDGEVVIVDEFTGRMQPGRRWSEGMHQAIEAKEGVKVQQESRTFASITYQNFFRMYDKLAGMTGTAETNAEEFFKVYGLEVVTVPTNTTIERIDKNDLIFQSEQGKFKAIARKVKELHEKGQPVLIGTVAIETNELLSDYLKQEGIPHNVLNAKQHEQEGNIVAQAGTYGAVTIATNMAGRGVDIALGGAPLEEEKYNAVKAVGGLFVLGTERHNARRIDNQLRGRSGRQGDPGETQFFVSLEDSLMRIFASDTVKNLMGRLGIAEDEPIENKIITRSLESAQTKIEGINFDGRKHVLEYDNVLNTQRTAIYKRRRAVLLGTTDAITKELDKLVSLYPKLSDVIAEKRKQMEPSEFNDVVRRLVLQAIDTLWVEHLETMGHLRSSVGLRAYGQRDPLIEYKKEGLHLFTIMVKDVDAQIAKMIPEIGAGAFEQEEARLKKIVKDAKLLSSDGAQSNKESNTTVGGEKVGRNEIVVIEKDGEQKEMKFKKAEPLIENDGWVLKQNS